MLRVYSKFMWGIFTPSSNGRCFLQLHMGQFQSKFIWGIFTLNSYGALLLVHIYVFLISYAAFLLQIHMGHAYSTYDQLFWLVQSTRFFKQVHEFTLNSFHRNLEAVLSPEEFAIVSASFLESFLASASASSLLPWNHPQPWNSFWPSMGETMPYQWNNAPRCFCQTLEMGSVLCSESEYDCSESEYDCCESEYEAGCLCFSYFNCFLLRIIRAVSKT